eukprot:4554721-Amphidinium_carterae.1
MRSVQRFMVSVNGITGTLPEMGIEPLTAPSTFGLFANRFTGALQCRLERVHWTSSRDWPGIYDECC